LSRLPCRGRCNTYAVAVSNPVGSRLVGSSQCGRAQPLLCYHRPGSNVSLPLTNTHCTNLDIEQTDVANNPTALQPQDPHHSVARSEACGSIGKWCSEKEQI
jgi:hypothetical protein